MASRNLQETVETFSDWIVRMRKPEGEGPFPAILLLHGWTGDENSMWIFTSRFPDDACLIAPRGIYRSKMGGFSWQEDHRSGWPSIDDFLPSADRLLKLLNRHNFPTADLGDLNVVGFSQGAALTYSLALLYPEKVKNLAGLSGFLPEGVAEIVKKRPLEGKAVFVAHGTQDEMVPVEKARQAVGKLEQAGATVSYCEDDVGHKLSLLCFKGLQGFFEKTIRT